MGLDTTHDCWHGSYGSFNTFRIFLASQIGVNLDECEGYGGDIEFSSIDHGIVPLLDHSDCDGILTPEECKSIADGLDDILSKLDHDDPKLKYPILYMIDFRDGCLQAFGNNENVEFH
jgi:hypothetical protein